MNVLEYLQSEKGSLIAAGIAGSAVSVAMEWNGVWPAVRRFVVGVPSAYWLSPIVVPGLQYLFDGLNVPPENAAGVGGFLMGVGGVIVMEIILKALRFRRDGLNVHSFDNLGGKRQEAAGNPDGSD